MTINLITFASILHKQVTIRSSHEAVLSELEKYFTVKFVDYRDIHQLTKDDFSIIFIATGGVERLVMQCFESLPRPAIILADGMQNSLAAALEISSWLRGRGMKSEILHGDFMSIVQRIQVLYTNFKAQRSLVGLRIGVIGTPSSWLIARSSIWTSRWNGFMMYMTGLRITKSALRVPLWLHRHWLAAKALPKI